MRLTRLELNEIIRARTGWTPAQARYMINMVLDTFTDTLARGDNIELMRFGTFRVERTLCRKGRNMAHVKGPRSLHLQRGLKSERLPPRWMAVVRFKMSRQMEKRVRSLIPISI